MIFKDEMGKWNSIEKAIAVVSCIPLVVFYAVLDRVRAW